MDESKNFEIEPRINPEDFPGESKVGSDVVLAYFQRRQADRNRRVVEAGIPGIKREY